MADFNDTRVSEKRFYAIPAQALIANGTTNGTITIASTYCWKVGQVITVSSSTSSSRRLKIKAILSETILRVGGIKTPIYKFEDVSDLLVADTAVIELIDDNDGNKRSTIDLTEIRRQIYEEEPTIALRNHLVDWLGRSYTENNPIPTAGTVPGIDQTEKIKNALLDASDLIKIFTWTTIQNTDVVTEIVFTSVKVDAFYGSTITLTRDLTYFATKPPTLNTVTDTLTII